MYPKPTDTSASTIDVSKARTVAERLRAIEASGRRLTGGQQWVLECCERRVRRAEPQQVVAS
jgi:hypothetical protein